MPAHIDSMFSVRSVPWHGEGVILDKRPKTIDEAISAAGLDWEVVQRPVYVEVGNDSDDELTVEPVDDYFVNIRTDTGKPLGIVTGRYTPVQNREAFSFLSNVFGSEMHFETAGALMGGRRVWVMMKLPEYVEVGGDPIGQYAFISNSHDGKSSVLAAMTPVRIVCMNTLGAALHLAKGVNAQRTYQLRHLGNMSQKIAEARNVLDVTINYYEQFKSVGDKLALAKFTDKKVVNVLEKLLPTEGLGDRAAENRLEARQAILSIYKGEGPEGDTTGNAPETAWMLYNAIGEYADWSRSIRKSRFQRIIDDPDGLKNKGFELVLASANLDRGAKRKAAA